MSTVQAGWTLVHDNRGGIHHYRRELGDGTLYSVSSPPSGGWWWGLYVGATGRKLAGTSGSRKSALDTADQAMAAADEYDRTRQESST
jgi:hypothetical protein